MAIQGGECPQTMAHAVCMCDQQYTNMAQDKAIGIREAQHPPLCYRFYFISRLYFITKI